MILSSKSLRFIVFLQILMSVATLTHVHSCVTTLREVTSAPVWEVTATQLQENARP